MRLPEVVVVDNNLTGGYSETYNDDHDHNQRIQFAMEIERAQERENRRYLAQRAQGGSLDGEVFPNYTRQRGSSSSK